VRLLRRKGTEEKWLRNKILPRERVTACLHENQVSLESRAYIRFSSHCSKTGGGPLIRFHFRLTFTSTRLAILMKGIFLFIP